jgi:chemotaxis protein MotB
LLVAALAGAAALACVSSGTHEAVVAERDALAKRVDLLERTKESLDSERVQLISELEEFRVAKEQLDVEVTELAERKEQLEIDLAKTEQQLAARTQEVDSLRSTYDGLVNDLQSEVAAGRVQIEQLRDGLHVKLAQEILFDSGSAELSPEGERVLGKVAGRLVAVEHEIEVSGHSDNVPISGALAARFPSNWELAGARAAVVVRLLVKRGIPPERLQATSFADTQPVAPNDSPEGRARNRRIDIRLVPPLPGAAKNAAPSA